jgi:hypothetical protein
MYERNLIAYLLKECGGLHPFHISRILALLDMKWIEKYGKKLTDIDYQKTKYGIWSNKLPGIIEELPVEKIKARPYGYLILKEDVPVNLPEDVLSTLNSTLDEICELSDSELNIKVLNSPFYDEL